MKIICLCVFSLSIFLASDLSAQEAGADSLKVQSSEAVQTAPAQAAAPPGGSRKKAWHPGNYWGAGVQVTVPRSSIGIDYKAGFGLQGMFNYPLIPLIDLSASVGWNHFDGEDDRPGIDIWELAFGARFALGVFFMNGEAGYFTEIEEWNYIPGLGLRFDHWEYSLRTKVAGDSVWSTFRIGYYF